MALFSEPSPPVAILQLVMFTSKERDSETGLDWFESRYFSSAQGRFTSPDGMIAKKEWLADPQRWNHYAYVRNNPLRKRGTDRMSGLASYQRR